MIFCFTVLKSVENLLPFGHADFAVASLNSTRMLSKMLGKIVSLNIPPIFICLSIIYQFRNTLKFLLSSLFSMYYCKSKNHNFSQIIHLHALSTVYNIGF
jgi:hypothetical protein